MRLFIAVAPSAEVVEKLAAIQRTLVDTKADVRWVKTNDYHVTVKFLGEVEEQLLGQLAQRMTKAAAEVPAFELEVEGLSRFPERGPARVIISRVISPDQRMTRLHRLIDSAVGGMGLPMDTRVLVPHLTLGRVNSNHGLNRLLRLLEKHDLDFFGSFPVERVVLYQSVQSKCGTKYMALCHAELGK
ncbi:MAG: RNA 2',3'-cyclic phosphodiesterase [Phycisphaerales bacterium]|nr:RNA 2',3'-cyclic phosphodiesterase [Phycisphaerales bacterium]